MDKCQKRLQKVRDQWEHMVKEIDVGAEEDDEDEGEGKKKTTILQCEEVKNTCMLSRVESLPVKMKEKMKEKEEDENEGEEESD